MGGANNPVSSIAAYLTQGTAANVSNVSSINSQKNSSQAAASSFDNILNKVSGNFVQTKTEDTTKDVNKQMTGAKETEGADTRTTEVKAVTEDTANTEVVNEQGSQVAATNETANTEVNDKLQEAINEAGEEIISQIAETFDISEEDIVYAMQVLGLMAADLLNPANLQQLVTEISGQEAAIDLITDSDIYTSLQDLMEGAESMKSELMNEFNLSDEDLQTAIEDAKAGFAGMLENSAEQNQNPEVTKELVTDTYGKELEAPDTKAPVSEAFVSEAPEEKPVVVETHNNKGGENKGNLQNGAESTNLFNQVMNNIADAAMDVEATSFEGYTDRTQMEDIIRQITEKITITQAQGETSMELALHPASLGHVNILLTSGKDGIVAKFTAQNEIVKEAVEAQMVQLQQKFSEQGIKVTSIEVTIASHEFEQNLDQHGDRQPKESNEGKKVRNLRRINLSELTDDIEAEPESDAERIAVQMMEANGNTVDFSA
ncbi:flagellar hook-length control protein FliK [Butyrivibrio sp. CB08]|uniref:flagellar hook-length control protein FliK n=1 Tax=Butyrivibrio sp. CB08 TaxID=2364879 RepID=UPI000EA95B61|nr:flagellar hook-length control protein FliK [Butyrivibrio sp. CB08]RKM62425.1 flagellar hook-length control protein FliK [Butyrivibrio sp. CB08]